MPDGIKNNRIRHITKGKESNLKNIIIMKELLEIMVALKTRIMKGLSVSI